MQIDKKNLPVKFMGFAATLLLLIFIVENINGRFWLNDFKVYCGGALAFLHGEPVYGVAFALGRLADLHERLAERRDLRKRGRPDPLARKAPRAAGILPA